MFHWVSHFLESPPVAKYRLRWLENLSFSNIISTFLNVNCLIRTSFISLSFVVRKDLVFHGFYHFLVCCFSVEPDKPWQWQPKLDSKVKPQFTIPILRSILNFVISNSSLILATSYRQTPVRPVVEEEVADWCSVYNAQSVPLVKYSNRVPNTT